MPDGRAKILLVDDREDGLIALEAALASPRYRIVKARSGREALARLLEEDFAVIVMDVQMPEMDGFETARLIKQRERCRQTPILFVTAINKEAAFVFRGYESGAVDYLFKPFDPYILQSKVSVFVELHEKTRLLQQQATRLRESEERTRIIIESARDIIGTLSPSGQVLSLSPAFTELTGFAVEDWVGRPVEHLIHPDDRSLLSTACERAANDNQYLWEGRLLDRAGRSILVEASLRPLNGDGEAVGTLVVVRDIRLRKQAEEDRRKRYELEVTNRSLEQFALVCSHDLQEPLRVVSTMTQLLQRKYQNRLDREADELVTSIVESTARMSALIKDLLEYSKIGMAQWEPEPVCAEAACREAVMNLGTAVEESGAEVSFAGLPQVQANRRELVQLFQNLIGNAIKFRGSAPPRVRVSAERGEEEWTFSIADNGIGFEPKYAEKLFLIFKRLHHRGEYPGNGVGLAICKKIVERHRGRIWVTSEKGVGSTFFFTLPLDLGLSDTQGSSEAAESVSLVS